MAAKRYLIVNADDFGLSPGVNQGILRGHEQGIVTSTSLMVRWPAATEITECARRYPKLSIGLHVDLAEWVYQNDEWKLRYQVVPPDERSMTEEVARQLEQFRRLVGRNPTHLDSHQHVHRNEPALSVLQRVAHELSVPLRSFTPGIHYCGDFYGQTGEGLPYPAGISPEGLLTTLAQLPPGISELGCHPGLDEGLDSVYRLERLREVKTLCDPTIRHALTELEVHLCSFAELPATELKPAIESPRNP